MERKLLTEGGSSNPPQKLFDISRLLKRGPQRARKPVGFPGATFLPASRMEINRQTPTITCGRLWKLIRMSDRSDPPRVLGAELSDHLEFQRPFTIDSKQFQTNTTYYKSAIPHSLGTRLRAATSAFERLRAVNLKIWHFGEPNLAQRNRNPRPLTPIHGHARRIRPSPTGKLQKNQKRIT